MSSYTVEKVDQVAPAASWDSDAWRAVPELAIASFRCESSDHHPDTRAKIVYDDRAICVKFRVRDSYVRAVARKLNDCVCCDSCVEFFVEPAGGKGYINFECAANGIFLAYHILDHHRGPEGFADYSATTPEEVREVEVATTLGAVIEPEIAGPVDWELGISIPFSLLTAKCGAPAPQPGSVWRANLFKCGDKTSHPHWASWQPVPQLNFHEPAAFGDLVFA